MYPSSPKNYHAGGTKNASKNVNKRNVKSVRAFIELEFKYLRGTREATGLFIVEGNDSRYQG